MYTAAGMSDEDESDYEGFTFGSSLPREPYVPPPIDPKYKILDDIYRGVKNSDLLALQKALDNDLEITLETPLQGNWTALMHACSEVNLIVVKFLLESGCSANTQTALFTPLMAACSTSNNTEENVLILVQLLIENNANINVADVHGVTPLMLACQIGYPSVVSELLSHKARVNDEDNQGRTALFWAVNENHYKICSLLIEKNCTIDIQDERGLTPMQLAVVKGFTEIVDLLECCEGGRKPNPYYSEVKQLIARHSWRDLIPGPHWCGAEEPPYYPDVDTILQGMEMEHLVPDILHHKITLTEFLAKTDDELKNLGVILPFQRKSILNHLQSFHVKRWSKNSIYIPKAGSEFSVFNYLIQLTSHYKHILVMHSSIIALRKNFLIHGQVQDTKSRERQEIGRALEIMFITINDYTREINYAKKLLKKVSSKTEKPVDFIEEKKHVEHESKYNWTKYTLFFVSISLSVAYAISRRYK